MSAVGINFKLTKEANKKLEFIREEMKKNGKFYTKPEMIERCINWVHKEIKNEQDKDHNRTTDNN